MSSSRGKRRKADGEKDFDIDQVKKIRESKDESSPQVEERLVAAVKEACQKAQQPRHNVSSNSHSDEDPEQAAFRQGMEAFADEQGKYSKSLVVSPVKYKMIMQYLKDQESMVVNSEFKKWIITFGFQLCDVGEERDVLFRFSTYKRDQIDGKSSALLRVLDSRLLFGVTRHVHNNIFNHGGYKKTLVYMQARYAGVTRSFVQHFVNACPTCQKSRYLKESRHQQTKLNHSFKRRQRVVKPPQHFDEVVVYENEDSSGSQPQAGTSKASYDGTTPQGNNNVVVVTQGSDVILSSHYDVINAQAGITNEDLQLSNFRNGDQAGNRVQCINTAERRTVVDGDNVYIITKQEPSEMDETETAAANISSDDFEQAEVSQPEQHNKGENRPSSTDSQKTVILPSSDLDGQNETVTIRVSQAVDPQYLPESKYQPPLECDEDDIELQVSNALNNCLQTVEICKTNTPKTPSKSLASSSTQSMRSMTALASRNKTPESSNPIDEDRFFFKVHVDIVDMTDTPDGNFRFICHVSDPSYKMHVLFPLNQASANVVAPELDQRVLALYGIPQNLYSNQGHRFMAELIACLQGIVEGGFNCINGEDPQNERGVRKGSRHETNIVKELIAILKVERQLNRSPGGVPWLSWLPRIMRSLNRDWHAALSKNSAVLVQHE